MTSVSALAIRFRLIRMTASAMAKSASTAENERTIRRPVVENRSRLEAFMIENDTSAAAATIRARRAKRSRGAAGAALSSSSSSRSPVGGIFCACPSTGDGALCAGLRRGGWPVLAPEKLQQAHDHQDGRQEPEPPARVILTV